MSAFNGAGLFLFLLMCAGIACAFLIAADQWARHPDHPVDLDEEDSGHYKPRDIR
jgi:hypothetical protein